jgi:eukaryotic-like serine/threonine-protein kinase
MRYLSLALLLAVTCAAAHADDWPRACHDLARTCRADGAGPALARVVWTADLGDSVDGSPVVLGDRIYVGTSGGAFYCLDRAGAIRWRTPLAGGVFSAAETSPDHVYVGCASGMVYALAAESGAVVWRHRTRRAVLGSPALVGQDLLFASMDGTLRAVDPATGRKRWVVSAPAGISGGLAADQGCVYYGDEAGHLHARQAASGASLWEATLAGRVVASPCLSGPLLLVPLMSGSALSPPAVEYVTAWDAATGARTWAVEKPGAISAMGPLCVAGSTVWSCTVEGYVSDGLLHGHTLAEGRQVAEIRLGRVVVDGAMALAGSSLYIAAESGVLYLADAATGAIARTLPLGGPLYSSPAVADGRLYVGCQDGRLYCIE